MNRPQDLPSVAETEQSIPERFTQIAARYPNQIAVSAGSTQWTYADLDAISANCAGSLQEKCQNAFAPVVLLMKHDAPLVAAIVGVLRSGGFYLALNSAFPARRLRQIVKEIRPRAIIADAEHQKIARELVGSKTQRFLIDELLTGHGCFSMSSISPSAPCALFYTSGSSQRPRPIVYRYGATGQSVTNHARLLHITTEDRLTLLSPCSAAASVSATFGALLNGACLFPFQPVREGLHRMEDWIRKNGITVYHSVPSLFRRFAQTLAPDEMLPTVRAVKLGGETVFATDVELFREHFPPGAILVNGLGLTEANGNICHFRLTHEMRITGPTVPIGKPNDGVEIKLVDRGLGEVASGEMGEIAVRGKQISPAYWTGSAVEQHLLDSDGWFRTGDLGRRNSEGSLEYLGRKDGQVKLHGQWVCIAEIEAILTQIPGVRDAAVVPVDISGQQKKIVAFVSWSKRPLPEQELRGALSRQLPPYSVPSHFFSLQQLPTLLNGKVDRRALLQQATQVLATKTKTRFDPSDLVTLQLVRTWRKTLENDSIGVADDFFISGGDSLAAATMLAAVEKHFGINLPASVLLEAPTIETLARLIRRGGWMESGMSLVALQSHGTKLPLYCVPGAGSEPLEFRRLAAYLGDDQPVFAFQPQGLDGRDPFHASVGEMAAYYLASLRRHQSRGPYCLCGQSFGGVVAFDMAKRLIENGDEVRFLGLFDSYAGEYPRVRQNLSLRKKLTLKIRNLDGCQNGVTIRSLIHGVKMRIKHHLIKLYVRLNFRSETMRRSHWRFLYHEACMAARRRHKLRPLPLKIHLFRVEDQPSAEFFEQDQLLGWSGMASEGIEVHKLRGDHGRLLHEPNVATLAQELRACLE